MTPLPVGAERPGPDSGLGPHEGQHLGMEDGVPEPLDRVDADRESAPDGSAKTAAPNGPPVRRWTFSRASGIAKRIRSASVV